MTVEGLPGGVLFACTMNAARSPMAEGIMKHLFGGHVYIDSAGVRAAEVDAFAVTVMAEIGIDLSRHNSKSFDELSDTSFDLVISLSPEAQHSAVEMTRTMSCEVEFWPTMDATAVDGSRERRLDAFRQVRDFLYQRIGGRFKAAPGAS
jgi:protein-tyrosine-phosphatase